MKKFLCKVGLSLFASFAILFASCAGESTTYVKKSVNSVVIKAEAGAVHVGSTIKLTAVVSPSDAYYDSIEWVTSDDDILSIANTGLTAIGLGEPDSEDGVSKRTAEVYAVIGGVMSGTLTVTVYDDGEEIPEDELVEQETNEEDSEKKEDSTPTPTPSGEDEEITKGGEDATGTLTKPEAAEIPTNASITIKEVSGWFNSAYVIFEQITGATYKVSVDGNEIDGELIRYYDTYTYNEPVENPATLAVTYTEKTYSKVVRADALGLKAGSHKLSIVAHGTNGDTDPTEVTVTVVDYDRSGFAFADGHEPGAYKKDGTLKDGAIVIYLTNDNINTVSQTFTTVKGKTETCTGIQAITQYVKAKNISTPVDIRVIGSVYATSSGELSCADLKSAWALGVKGAANVTIEGVGHDATLYGAGLAAFQSEDIEFTNFGLMKWGGGKDGDGISLKADSYVWVHNNDVFYGDAGSDGDQVKGDGSMDLKDDSNHVAIAYNHFWDSGKMSLCGMKSESGPNYITYHHNWFDHSDSRHPRIRTMTVHVYNNYFDGNSKYGVGVTTGASCFVEGNFFRDAHDPMMSSGQGTDAVGGGTFSGEKGGVIKSYNNKYEQNNLYQKFQFITNKYDWTNNQAVTEPETHNETVGTANSDGSYTIYDEKADASTNTIAISGFITVESGASFKTDKYQVSKGKDGFTLSVPTNTTKIIVKAKCGSSDVSGTLSMLKVGSKTVSINATDNYTDYEVSASDAGVSSGKVVISNANSKYAMNVREIKVIAATGWTTTYTTGISLSDIDAYEVDNRDDTVPSTVTAKDGGSTYSNFDVKMGDSGMGVTVAPTDPDEAKEAVITYSGRYHSDFAYAFDNSVDDASYAKNDALNTALLNYKNQSGLTALQGE